MATWLTIIAVLVGFLILARLDVRGPSNQPVYAWNIAFGTKPRDGETQAGFTFRKLVAALVATVVLAIPLFLGPTVPDEGANFTGNESTIGLLIVIVFLPLTALSALTAAGAILALPIHALFRRNHVFDSTEDAFVRRQSSTSTTISISTD